MFLYSKLYSKMEYIIMYEFSKHIDLILYIITPILFCSCNSGHERISVYRNDNMAIYSFGNQQTLIDDDREITDNYKNMDNYQKYLNSLPQEYLKKIEEEFDSMHKIAFKKTIFHKNLEKIELLLNHPENCIIRAVFVYCNAKKEYEDFTPCTDNELKAWIPDDILSNKAFKDCLFKTSYFKFATIAVIEDLASKIDIVIIISHGNGQATMFESKLKKVYNDSDISELQKFALDKKGIYLAADCIVKSEKKITEFGHAYFSGFFFFHNQEDAKLLQDDYLFRMEDAEYGNYLNKIHINIQSNLPCWFVTANKSCTLSMKRFEPIIWGTGSNYYYIIENGKKDVGFVLRIK